MLLFAEGFEHYGSVTANMLLGLWSELSVGVGATITLPTTQKRTGARSLLIHPGSSGVTTARFSLGTTAITCGLGVGVYMVSLPVSNSLIGFQFRDATNTAILTICFQSDGSICARKGGVTGTIIDVSDSILTAGTFNHIECKATFDTVAGYVEIRVNGRTKLQIGSLNLGALGAAQMALMSFSPLSPDTYFDDVFAWDSTGTYNNNFMGPQRVLTVFPTGDTAQADWTKVGSATGYGAINNVPEDDDTTYLYSATVGHKSDFSVSALPPETATISGIFIPAMAKLDAAGIGNLKISLKSSAALLAGPDNPLTTGYTYYRSVFEYDPNTSAAWTKAGFEAALVRVEKSL